MEFKPPANALETPSAGSPRLDAMFEVRSGEAKFITLSINEVVISVPVPLKIQPASASRSPHGCESSPSYAVCRYA
jgi:hypothetical protein